MTTTLLAVDDSVTMRKVLELTFAGESFRVVTADSAESALAKLRSERPALVLADVTLEGTNGYTLCQKIKAESPSTPVIILSSRQQPYDVAKGSAARVDDYIDKPFDTQQLIDKVKKALGQSVAAPVSPFASSRSASSWKAVSAGPPPRPAPVPVPSPGLRHTPAPGAVGSVPGMAQGPRRTLSYTSESRPPTTSRTSTSAFAAVPSPPMPARSPSANVPAVSPSPVASSPRPPAAPPSAPAKPASAPAASAPAAAPAPAAPAAGAARVAIPADLSTKLGELGLTEAQVAGVLALSREVIEKVVWEVVPVLAETMIKEEIERLTAE